MRSFLLQFSGCLELMRRLPPPEAAAQSRPDPGAAGQPSAAVGAGSGAGSGSGGGGEAAPTDPAAAYRQSVEAAVGTFLVLMTNMRCVRGEVGLTWTPGG